MAQLSDLASRSRGAILELAIRGLRTSCGLQEEAAKRLQDDVYPLAWIPAGGRIRWQDETPGPKLIVRGWAAGCRFVPGVRRQVFDFLIPGDICFPAGKPRGHRVELVALTTTRVLSLSPALGQRPSAAMRDMLRSAHDQSLARLYDAALRLGQLTSEERTLDLLAELRDRLAALELVNGEGFRVPVTQADIADALGMSSVHLNRTLAALSRRGLVKLQSGRVVLSAPAKARIADPGLS